MSNCSLLKILSLITMNYLAHAYLSFGIPEILTGNMISDFVKGKKKLDYAEGVQKGIRLHRNIDEFTDFHPVTQKAKSFFKKQYRLYAGAFVDIVFDHFLALDKNEFSSEKNLDVFCQDTYVTLQANYSFLPEKFQQMLPYMQIQNWLYNYRLKEGIERSFGGLARRAVYLSESKIAYGIFCDEYDALQVCYNDFFSQLKNFTTHQLQKLITS